MLRTERLLLRHWRTADRDPFAELNADPETMRYFPGVLTRDQSDALLDRISVRLDERGWGLWAVEVPGVAPFIGFIGLNPVPLDILPFSMVELSFRLHRDHWGQGYATEGGGAALRYAFKDLRLDEVVAFTAEVNTRSRKVLERLGMSHDSHDDFDHPMIRSGELRRHVLYRIRRG